MIYSVASTQIRCRVSLCLLVALRCTERCSVRRFMAMLISNGRSMSIGSKWRPKRSVSAASWPTCMRSTSDASRTFVGGSIARRRRLLSRDPMGWARTPKGGVWDGAPQRTGNRRRRWKRAKISGVEVCSIDPIAVTYRRAAHWEQPRKPLKKKGDDCDTKVYHNEASGGRSER